MKGAIWLVIGISVLLGFGIYSFYDVFITENPSPFSYLFFVSFVLVILFVVSLAVLDRLSDSYPNSRFLKSFKKHFQDVSEFILDAISRI